MPLTFPPHTIISEPVQITDGPVRGGGAPAPDGKEIHESVAGSYRAPVFK
jgi:hypothetical protein